MEIREHKQNDALKTCCGQKPIAAKELMNIEGSMRFLYYCYCPTCSKTTRVFNKELDAIIAFNEEDYL
jgi:hypothetical protein